MANSPLAAGFAGCKKTDATQQMGCLVAADPCTLGYDGLSVLSQPSIKSLVLRTPSNNPAAEVSDSGANILKLLDGCPSIGTRYPLARKLWVHALVGLPAVTNAPDPAQHQERAVVPGLHQQPQQPHPRRRADCQQVHRPSSERGCLPHSNLPVTPRSAG